MGSICSSDPSTSSRPQYQNMQIYNAKARKAMEYKHDDDGDSGRHGGCAIIVGVGIGMGRSLALRFARGGYNLALVSRNKDKLKPLIAEINQEYPSITARAVSADASDPEKCERAFKEITDSQNGLGNVEVLLYNATYHGQSDILQGFPSFTELDVKQYEKAFLVAAKGLFIWAQLVLPIMVKNEDNLTSIIITGATASIRGSAKFSSFASSKFAARALAQSLAREFGPKGVHVAHIVIDGRIMRDHEKIKNRDNGTRMNPTDIADTYYFVHQQPQSAWVHELDLRANMEKF